MNLDELLSLHPSSAAAAAWDCSRPELPLVDKYMQESPPQFLMFKAVTVDIIAMMRYIYFIRRNQATDETGR